MEALIIMGANMKYTPYYHVYTDALRNAEVPISLIYWNRTLEKEKLDDDIDYYAFDCKLDNSISVVKKIPGFLRFRHFIKHVIKKKSNYMIVALDTQFAILISDILIKNKNKYVYDMRDLSYERFAIYKKIMNYIAKNSANTFLSSEGYTQFFNYTEKINILHNYKKNDPSFIPAHRSFRDGDTIRVSYWGCLRDFDIYKELVTAFANDSRYELYFYGTLASDMENLYHYTQEQRVKNITFYGEYSEDDRYQFAKSTDVILNVYFNSFNNSNPIMSNKYYDGVFFGIPQICTKGSFMGRLVKKKSLGLQYNGESDFPDRLYKYLINMDYSAFLEFCKIESNRIVDEQNHSLHILDNTIEKIEGLIG